MPTATLSWGSQSFAVSAVGFRWQKSDGQVVQGPWSRVASVVTLGTSASVNGFHVGTWQQLAVTLDDGQHFNAHSRVPQAFEVAALTEQYAAPFIVARVLQQLDAGQTVTFGPVALSRTAISYKKKSWPLAQLAGHRTVQGHWMMDVGPKDRPSLAVQVQLNRVPNLFALRQVLERLVPGSEYAAEGPDLGTVFRPSASSHDPRYPSGRTRLMLIGALVGTALLVAGVIFGQDAMERSRYEEANRATQARLAKAMKVAEALQVTPGTPFTCDVTTPDTYAVVFATRGPAGINRPGLVDQDEPFSNWGSGTSTVGAFVKVDYLVMGEVRGVNDGAVTVAMKVVDTQTMKPVCTGELMGEVDPKSEYGVTYAIEDVLVLSVCRNPEKEVCADAMRRTKLLTAPPQGTVRPEAIRDVVRKDSKKVRHCYEAGLKKNPELEGKVEVQFVIGPKGRVTKVSDVSETPFPDPAVPACIVKVAQDWRFPKPVGGDTVTVKYPFILAAQR